MKILGKILIFFVYLLPYFLVFVSSLYSPNDPDLGWHLKYGEYFFQHGSVLRENIFSTMMPDFRWANVSWGTDVVTYLAYALGGFLSLTILSAAIVTLTFFFFSKAARLSIWDETLLFPLILYLENPINSVSFRGQQISLLLLGVLVYILSKSEKNSKILYFTIPLFLLWVNLHGQFFLGLAFFGLWVALTFVQRLFFVYGKNLKQTLLNEKKLASIFLLSVFITLINPFGIEIHKDVMAHIGSPYLKNIAEYLPFSILSQAWWNQVVVAVLLVMGLIFLFFRERLSANIPLLGGISLLYLLSFSVRRYAWPAYYLTFSILKPLSSIFKPNKKIQTLISSAILLVFMLFIVFFDKYPFSTFTTYSWEKYCRQYYLKCSPKSAEFIIKNDLSKDLYSLYGWGGWLIWNYQEIKPSIDGRMHMWKDDKGYSGFVDYYGYEQNFKDINDSKYNVVYISPEKPIYGKMQELVSNGKWKLVYKDKFAGVFVRVK